MAGRWGCALRRAGQARQDRLAVGFSPEAPGDLGARLTVTGVNVQAVGGCPLSRQAFCCKCSRGLSGGHRG